MVPLFVVKRRNNIVFGKYLILKEELDPRTIYVSDLCFALSSTDGPRTYVLPCKFLTDICTYSNFVNKRNQSPCI